LEGATAASTSPSAAVETVDLYHELGPEPEDQTAEAEIAIAQGSPPTTVHIKSHVIAHGAKSLKSAEYLATIRRREAQKMAELIQALADHAESDDFMAWTHEPLERLRGLIYKLTEAEQFEHPEHEGNSCEILRQLRDTLLNAGWKRYREPAVRDVAVNILQRIAVADEISADDTSRTMDQLLDLGLDPTTGMVWQDGEQEEVPD
jgi:hypothetical protein